MLPPPTKKMAGGPVYFLCIKYRPPIEAIYAFFYNHEKKANLFWTTCVFWFRIAWIQQYESRLATELVYSRMTGLD